MLWDRVMTKSSVYKSKGVFPSTASLLILKLFPLCKKKKKNFFIVCYLRLMNQYAGRHNTWDSWVSICFALIHPIEPQIRPAVFQHRFIWLQMSCSRAKRREDPQSFYTNWRLYEFYRESGQSSFNSFWHNIPPQGASCSTLILARNKPDRDYPVLRFLLWTSCLERQGRESHIF